MTISINNWKLEPSLNALVHVETGEVQRLGEFHFILLETLVKHAGEVVPRATLINEVWKNRVVGNNSLPTAIYALRVALGDDGRQQEVIKTIPKKGYLFSKESIVVLDDEPATAPLLAEENAAPEAVTDEENAPGVEQTAPAPGEAAHSRRPEKKKSRAVAVTVLVLLVIAVCGWLLRPYFVKAPQSIAINESSLTIEEVEQPYPTIKIYHVQHRGAERGLPTLAKSAPMLFTSLNQLLAARHSSMTIYYYSSVQKLSIDLLVKNQCQTEYQLMMNINNWLPDITKLDKLINQEVERTLNEMPVCH